MTPLSEFPSNSRREIRYFLADIDDTMTRDGKLPAASYDALWRLHDAGLEVIPVTGRPAGWCDLICRQWPVAGVVGENGAFAMFMEGDHLQVMYHPNAPDPGANAARLREIAAEVFRRVPGTRWAKDQFARLFDVAIDFREEPPLLGFEEAREIQRIFEERGARAKVSSIHVNAWFGDYDKVSMAAEFLRRRFGLNIDDASQNARAVFCGDSPNDEPMFARFENSIAVANIAPFLSRLSSAPRYVTAGTAADGFCELVDVLLAL